MLVSSEPLRSLFAGAYASSDDVDAAAVSAGCALLGRVYALGVCIDGHPLLAQVPHDGDPKALRELDGEGGGG